MAGKRIIVDHQHAQRQHKAFAFMVIVSLLVVFAVWFVQVKLMVRTVDFTKLQQSVADAQAVFQASDDDVVVDSVTEETANDSADSDPSTDSTSSQSVTEDAVRAEIAARAAAAITTANNEPQTTNTPTP